MSALCTVHYLSDSARLGWAMRRAVDDHHDGTVAFLASGSLSHRFAQNGLAPEFAHQVWSPFLERLDRLGHRPDQRHLAGDAADRRGRAAAAGLVGPGLPGLRQAVSGQAPCPTW